MCVSLLPFRPLVFHFLPLPLPSPLSVRHSPFFLFYPFLPLLSHFQTFTLSFSPFSLPLLSHFQTFTLFSSPFSLSAFSFPVFVTVLVSQLLLVCFVCVSSCFVFLTLFLASDCVFATYWTAFVSLRFTLPSVFPSFSPECYHVLSATPLYPFFTTLYTSLPFLYLAIQHLHCPTIYSFKFNTSIVSSVHILFFSIILPFAIFVPFPSSHSYLSPSKSTVVLSSLNTHFYRSRVHKPEALSFNT